MEEGSGKQSSEDDLGPSQFLSSLETLSRPQSSGRDVGGASDGTAITGPNDNTTDLMAFRSRLDALNALLSGRFLAPSPAAGTDGSTESSPNADDLVAVMEEYSVLAHEVHEHSVDPRTRRRRRRLDRFARDEIESLRTDCAESAERLLHAYREKFIRAPSLFSSGTPRLSGDRPPTYPFRLALELWLNAPTVEGGDRAVAVLDAWGDVFGGDLELQPLIGEFNVVLEAYARSSLRSRLARDAKAKAKALEGTENLEQSVGDQESDDPADKAWSILRLLRRLGDMHLRPTVTTYSHVARALRNSENVKADFFDDQDDARINGGDREDDVAAKSRRMETVRRALEALTLMQDEAMGGEAGGLEGLSREDRALAIRAAADTLALSASIIPASESGPHIEQLLVMLERWASLPPSSPAADSAHGDGDGSREGASNHMIAVAVNEARGFVVHAWARAAAALSPSYNWGAAPCATDGGADEGLTPPVCVERAEAALLRSEEALFAKEEDGGDGDGGAGTVLECQRKVARALIVTADTMAAKNQERRGEEAADLLLRADEILAGMEKLHGEQQRKRSSSFAPRPMRCDARCELVDAWCRLEPRREGGAVRGLRHDPCARADAALMRLLELNKRGTVKFSSEYRRSVTESFNKVLVAWSRRDDNRAARRCLELFEGALREERTAQTRRLGGGGDEARQQQQRGPRPDADGYLAVLGALAKRGEEVWATDRAVAILEIMERSYDEDREARRLQREDVQRGYHDRRRGTPPIVSAPKPAASHYALVVAALARGGKKSSSSHVRASDAAAVRRRARRAQDLLDRLEARFDATGDGDLKPDARLYTSVMSAWARVKGGGGRRETSGTGQGGRRSQVGWVDDHSKASADERSNWTGAQHAQKLLERLETRYMRTRDEALRPDGAAYAAVLNALANFTPASRNADEDCQRALEDAKGIMRRMAENHARAGGDDENSESSALRPDAKIHTPLVVLLARGGRPDEAEDVLRQMDDLAERTGNDAARPDTVAYSAAINGWARSGRGREAIDRAASLVAEMEERYDGGRGDRNVRPNVVTYTSLISALWKNADAVKGAAGEAEAVLDMVERRFREDGDLRCRPDNYMYVTVINSWGRSSADDVPDKAVRAMDVLRRMETAYLSGTNLDARPNAVAYTAVLNACSHSAKGGERCRTEALEVVRELLKRMRAGLAASEDGLVDSGDDELGQVSIRPNAKTFVELFRAYHHLVDDKDEREELLAEAFELCCRAGLVEEFVLDTLGKFAPRLLRKVPGVDGRNFNYRQIPERWRRNVR